MAGSHSPPVQSPVHSALSFPQPEFSINATPKNLLFAWIGDADLAAWAAASGGDAAVELERSLGRRLRAVEGDGPIKTLVEQQSFDDIHLLCDKVPEIAKRFAVWIGPNTHPHVVSLQSPVDYAAIFEAANRVLAKVVAKETAPYRLSIHLSPGTPAMTAVWVLLGKSRYPAEFFQTHRGKVIPTTIPFDLLVDYVPSVLQASDRLLQASDIPAENDGFGDVIGRSSAIREVVRRARRIAVRDVNVLILGESGVGKEVFARAIHATSARAKQPFVGINCAAMPKDLLEAELFGHVKGAFTGSIGERKGAFEQAHMGTLFLDEVGECDLAMQAKLLRVLQPPPNAPPAARVIRRVGDTVDRPVNVRVVAATNRDLPTEIAAGRFREDLYYRLSALSLTIPPLRERLGDIPLIADHLLELINRDFAQTEPGYADKSLSIRTKAFLSQQTWPGNVRQLYNALLQAAVMADRCALLPSDFQHALLASGKPPPGFDPPIGSGFCLQSYLEDTQRRFLIRAMREAAGRKSEAARLLGYANYQTLSAQLDRLKVDWRES